MPSGSPYEPVIGFSRVVVAGHHVAVAATAPIMPDGGEPPADAYGQAKRCLEIIVAALEEAGASVQDVIRTRCFIVAAEDWEEVVADAAVDALVVATRHSSHCLLYTSPSPRDRS